VCSSLSVWLETPVVEPGEEGKPERWSRPRKAKLEGRLGLEINREKTRVVNLKEEGASLDFLGFAFRYYEDLQGRGPVRRGESGSRRMVSPSLLLYWLSAFWATENHEPL
jgi:hypothetical protein